MTFLPKIAAALLPFSLVFVASAQTPAHHWIGTATVLNSDKSSASKVTATVPVELDLSAPTKNGSVTGTFLNGAERSQSSDGILSGSHLVLHFHSFARTFEGDIQGNTLQATFGGARMKTWHVTLHTDRDGKPRTTFAAARPAEKGGTINGDWEISGKSSKGESAWTMHVAPFAGNGEIRAVIQHVDGDTGGLYGRFDVKAGEYRVSRFADSGATIYALKPNADGTLQVTNLRDPAETNVARRPADARKAQLAPPTPSTEQTSVKNPAEPLRFSGPNLAGSVISSTDEHFRGKVLIVAIGGSWCPNCHDEAPFLVELYNRFHQRGLEVVDLSFEEEDQLKNPERLRAFVTKYNIPYPVLLMGTPDDLNDRLPQGKNLNSWPTSFFIGRDGLVKETHAGFSGPATGQANVELKAEVTSLVEKLLSQSNQASR
ncbi:MAG: TlpA disulfide reductase family protein [Janthinobacterium lividum]